MVSFDDMFVLQKGRWKSHRPKKRTVRLGRPTVQEILLNGWFKRIRTCRRSRLFGSSTTSTKIVPYSSLALSSFWSLKAAGFLNMARRGQDEHFSRQTSRSARRDHPFHGHYFLKVLVDVLDFSGSCQVLFVEATSGRIRPVRCLFGPKGQPFFRY